VDLSSAGRLRYLPALVAGAEALVETLCPAVLLQHPQVETAVGVVRATPRRNLGHEASAYASPLVLGSDVDVVEKRSPGLVVSTVSAGKADQFVVLLGENDELIRRRCRKSLLPDAEPILEDVTVEVLIPISPAIERPPTLGVQRGDCHRVRSGGFSKAHEAIHSLPWAAAQRKEYGGPELLRLRHGRWDAGLALGNGRNGAERQFPPRGLNDWYRSSQRNFAKSDATLGLVMHWPSVLASANPLRKGQRFVRPSRKDAGRDLCGRRNGMF
jgi:hypothetical protein